MHQIPINMEDAKLYLSCATKNLTILLEGIQEDLMMIEKTESWLGTSNLMDHCDALFFAIRSLDMLQADMDAAIEAAYTKGD